MLKKIDTADLKQKTKAALPWIITAASVGATIAVYRHYDTKQLLEVPKGAHRHMIETQNAMIYCSDFGDFALTALPAGSINP